MSPTETATMANVGTLDRIARFVVGLALLVVAFAVPAAEAALGVAWWLLPIAGVVMIGTVAIRFCPLYTVLGMRTCPMPKG
jgi:hypothetical protein